MPILSFGNTRINAIGDVHLGRSFKTGVPLHRLGEREEMVWAELESQLQVQASFTIFMGDVFDKFVVPPEVVLRFRDLLVKYATPTQPVFILRGNHDASRDASKASSFDLLAELVLGSGAPITPVATSLVVFAPDLESSFALFGWQPFVSAEEAVIELPKSMPGNGVLPRVRVAFGHWDTIQHGDNTHNMIPLEPLAAIGVETVVTGHVHKAEEFNRQGLRVIVTGSMQPYAHGEQPEGSRLYMTLTPAEIEAELQQDPNAFINTNLRVLLPPGEEYSGLPDCLSLTVKRTNPSGDDEEAPQEVDTATFDLKGLLGTSCEAHSVSKSLQNRIETSLMERLNNA